MKGIYVKPQITERGVCVKNYMICATAKVRELTWDFQRGKERNTNDDIWGSSDSEEENVW